MESAGGVAFNGERVETPKPGDDALMTCIGSGGRWRVLGWRWKPQCEGLGALFFRVELIASSLSHPSIPESAIDIIIIISLP